MNGGTCENNACTCAVEFNGACVVQVKKYIVTSVYFVTFTFLFILRLSFYSQSAPTIF